MDVVHAVQPFFLVVRLAWQIVNIDRSVTRAYPSTVALTTPAVGLPILTGMPFRRDNLRIYGYKFVLLAQVRWLPAFVFWVLYLVLLANCVEVLLI